ncbi:MAG: hypothetical protein J6Z14_09765 [Prevotella sp.]|nr:hypothetical protein [Prevotella sp.]
MKKTYIQPACNITRVETQKIMVSSPTPDQLGKSGGNVIGDNNDASRLSFNVWGDDEDEE